MAKSQKRSKSSNKKSRSRKSSIKHGGYTLKAFLSGTRPIYRANHPEKSLKESTEILTSVWRNLQ